MGKSKVADIIKTSTVVQYKDNYRFCEKVVKTVMSVVPKERVLEGKEVEILSVMCGMCIGGKNYMSTKLVVEEMEVMGLSPVKRQVLKNYWSSLRTKGWLVGKQFNMKLMQAIKDGRCTVMIFLDDGKS